MEEKLDCIANRLLTCAEAANFLRVSPTTIRTWTSRRQIPFVKLNGRRTVRYRLTALERLLETIEPQTEPGENAE